MTTLNDVLDVMRTRPNDLWTSSQVSAPLNCPPSTANGRLRKLANDGQVVRVSAGLYRLPRPEAAFTPERIPETEIPVSPLEARNAVDLAALKVPQPERDLPPMRESVIRVTELECEQLLGCLKAQGRPMSATMLLGRLARTGWKAATLHAALNLLTGRGHLSRDDQDRYAPTPHKVGAA